jgi:uncharacterized membrane protein required for colicin V production
MNEALAPLRSIDTTGALQTFVAYGIVLTSLVLCGLNGLRIRIVSSVIAFAEYVAAGVAAILWCTNFGTILRLFGCPRDWSLVVAYAGVFLGVLLILQLMLWRLVRAEVMTFPMLVDRIGGLLIGVMAGVLLASIIRVGFAMSPFSSTVVLTEEQMRLDVTPRVLQMISRIVSADPKIRSAWLFGAKGEPVQGAVGPGRIVWSEPYVDENDNDLFDRDERFIDKDGNGEFTAALSVGDEEKSRGLRVGVMERYWIGNWRRVKVELGSHQNPDDPNAPVDE